MQHAAEDNVTAGHAGTEEGARPEVEALPVWVRLSLTCASRFEAGGGDPGHRSV